MNQEDAQREIRNVFTRAGAHAAFHVCEVSGPDPGGSVGVDDDMPVCVASVTKIVFCLTFARQVAAGAVDPRKRVEVPDAYRLGGSGTAGCLDPVQMSLRDLALSMMTVSDNAATDVIVQCVGRGPIDGVLAELGLAQTHFRGDMLWGHMRAVDELGLSSLRDIDDQLEQADDAALWKLAWLDPAQSNASTPREMARLLDLIWTDRAGPPQACEFVRSAMAQQVTGHRLAAGFDQAGVHVAGKTGTLPAIRNEAGVVSYPDGRRYAAAIFTRADSLVPRQPRIDAAIGAAARIAVDHLRSVT